MILNLKLKNDLLHKNSECPKVNLYLGLVSGMTTGGLIYKNIL